MYKRSPIFFQLKEAPVRFCGLALHLGRTIWALRCSATVSSSILSPCTATKKEYSGIVPRPRDRLLPIRGIRPTYGIRCSVPEVRLARVPSFDCFAAASYLAFLVAICASIMLPATTPRLQGLVQRRQCMRGWYIPGRYHRRELSPTLP